MASQFSSPTAWGNRIARALEVSRIRSELPAVRLLVAGLRPEEGSGTPDDAEAHLRALLDHLRDAPPGTGEALGRLLRTLLRDAHVFPALTESGVPGSEGFVSGLLTRLGRRVLPQVPDPEDLRDIVRTVFDRPDDHLWVEAVPDARWRELLHALGIHAETVHGVGDELAAAVRVLAHHAASLGLQPEVTHRLPHLEQRDSPFLLLSERVLAYLRSFENEVEGDEEPHLDAALDALERCRDEVERLRAEKGRYGTSLWLTGLSFRLLLVLHRLELLLHLGEPVERDFQGCAVRLFKEIVRAEKTRDHLVPFVRGTADLLAYQVVEHAARKGSKYITHGRRDYVLFLLSSMGGGFIVALFALAKVVMSQWSVPLGVQAFLFGINYSLCFVLIYLTGATLATKQPAMTANTIARSMGGTGDDLGGLEELIVRVWRSQFISFVGNLIVAFPVAMLLSELFLQVAGGFVASPEKAGAMLVALHPWWSGTVAYAAMAGVLLFAAGLVAGWVDNWNLNHRIRRRVAGHPVLVRLVGAERAVRIATGLDKRMGALVGNVFLGFGLGSLGTVGTILGLPLDIRHIAFASAEFGMSVEVLQFDVPLELAVQVGLGVAVIGLVNFLVSFGLSLMTALESRAVGFGETRRLLAGLGRRLLRRPQDWFFPPRPGPGGEATATAERAGRAISDPGRDGGSGPPGLPGTRGR